MIFQCFQSSRFALELAKAYSAPVLWHVRSMLQPWFVSPLNL
jgi:hypothetical protein